jgi:hypothetical protein
VTEIRHDVTLSDNLAARAAAQVQALVRDSFSCLACGNWGDGAFPRVQRLPAGTAVPRDLTDLVTLCHSCRELSSAGDPRLHYRGMWLLPAEDPAEKPVYAIADGPIYDIRWLLPDGTVTRDPRLTVA